MRFVAPVKLFITNETKKERDIYTEWLFGMLLDTYPYTPYLRQYLSICSVNRYIQLYHT